MNGPAGIPWGRLPAWARPRDAEQPGSGRTRLVETAVLALVGLLLAIATVNDVVLGTHVNHRLSADQATWRAFTHHRYKNLTLDQDQKTHTTRDVVCGNTSPGPPKERQQICLTITGPVRGGRRTVRGGWYLPAKTQNIPAARYGCFGAAKSEQLCRR